MQRIKELWNKNVTGKIAIIVGGLILICIACGIFTAILPESTTAVPTQDVNAIYTQAAMTLMAEMQPDIPAAEPTLPMPENTPLPADTPIPAPTQNPNLIPAGTYLVGTNIQPGYFTGQAGQGIFESCYWARLSDVSGSMESLLANDNSEGKYYLEVKASDYALKTDCNLTYLPTLPPPVTEFPTNISPGLYLVGIDILPGTYQGQGGTDILDSCYWARLSNVAGDMNALLANDNASGQYYVQVQASDFAFKTACELTRIGD